jgi:hypothetical protein
MAEAAEADDDFGSVSDLVDKVAATVSGGDSAAGDQGQAAVNAGQSGADGQVAPVAAVSQDGVAPKDGQQPQVDADGTPIVPASGQEFNPVVDEAIAYIEKLTGKELSDNELVEAMAKSVMNGEKFHNRDIEDIKELTGLVEQRDTTINQWNDWYSQNKMEEIFNDPRVQAVVEEIKTGVVRQPTNGEDFLGEIPPAVLKELQDLRSQVGKFQGALTNKEKAEQQAVTKEAETKHIKTIREFSAKDPDFKKELDEYGERAKINKWTKLPEKLAEWDRMVRAGINPDKAWKVINEDKLTEKITKEISQRQEDKNKNPKILTSGQRPPISRNYDDTQDFDSFWGAVVENAGVNK